MHNFQYYLLYPIINNLKHFTHHYINSTVGDAMAGLKNANLNFNLFFLYFISDWSLQIIN